MDASTEPTPWPSPTAEALECDFCGRSLHRETAVQRVEHAGDDVEIVTLCVDCAQGDD